MKLLFEEEVCNKVELENKLAHLSLQITSCRVGVIAMITDTQGNLLLQRRGPNARDEQFMLEQIGGGVEEMDSCYRNAILREMKEEVGEDAVFSIDEFVGVFLDTKFDTRIQQKINWIFLVYQGTYLGGNLQITEPEKCLGYELYSFDQLPQEEISNGCSFLNTYWYNKERGNV